MEVEFFAFNEAQTQPFLFFYTKEKKEWQIKIQMEILKNNYLAKF